MKQPGYRAAAFMVVLGGACAYLWGTSDRLSALSGGPPPAVTGAPGEVTCHQCHQSYEINDPSGSVMISGLPNPYTPGGDPVPFAVTVMQDGTNGANIDWGFEDTVLDANNAFPCADPDNCGQTLRPLDGDTTTQPDNTFVGGGQRFYVKQTLDGTFSNPDGSPSATWSMLWTPPATDLGPLTFYAAGNAGNGDHTSAGDYIFLTSITISGPGSAGAASNEVAPTALPIGLLGMFRVRGRLPVAATSRSRAAMLCSVLGRHAAVRRHLSASHDSITCGAVSATARALRSLN